MRGDGASFGAPIRIDDLAALHRRWYGARLFTTDCPGNEPLVDRRGRLTMPCPGANPIFDEVSVIFGTRTIGHAINPEPVGVIAP